MFPAPEGGATLAALLKLKEQGLVDKDERVVLFNTGSGHKYLEALSGGLVSWRISGGCRSFKNSVTRHAAWYSPIVSSSGGEESVTEGVKELNRQSTEICWIYDILTINGLIGPWWGSGFLLK